MPARIYKQPDARLHTLKRVIQGIVVAFILFLLWLKYLDSQLPDVGVLNDVHLQLPMRVYTADNKLMGEFGEVHRIPVTLDQIPAQVIQATLATEDHRFFEHEGVDMLGLLRAAIQVAITGKKSQGGSTITMQVARNFFLSRQKTYTRKLKEILLAFKIDRELSKQKILELYLNKIFYGHRSYGIAAAAYVYYGMALDKLNLAQSAMLAGLPQSPSRINPITNPKAALERRNIVLERMLDSGYITKAQFDKASKEPNTAKFHGAPIQIRAPHAAEMVRDTMLAQYGDQIYTEGFNVYTTIDSKAQVAAEHAVRTGILAFTKRHNRVKAEDNWGDPNSERLKEWTKKLKHLPVFNGLKPAVVLNVAPSQLTVLLMDGSKETISKPGLAWFGQKADAIADYLKPGDVIRLDHDAKTGWIVSLVPQVQAALVALNPHNGAIEALVGGFSFSQSKFNRATQSYRQLGSTIKPFIYSAALDKGYTLATVLDDEPIMLWDNDHWWRPNNATKDFYGPMRLRDAIVFSRNLVSIRLLKLIGVSTGKDYLTHFGFEREQIPGGLSLSLGTPSVTPLQVARAYSVFANGGYLVNPYIISSVTNIKGDTIFHAEPAVACANCLSEENKEETLTNSKYAPRVIESQIAYMMSDVLRDVVQRGTGAGAKVLTRHDIGGKTGTTNEYKDAWFAGFNPDLVAITWVGYDQPRALKEYGAQAALPIWVDFMRVALQGKPERILPEPPGLIRVKIDPESGQPISADNKEAIFEIFRDENTPDKPAPEPSADSESQEEAKLPEEGLPTTTEEATKDQTVDEVPQEGQEAPAEEELFPEG